MTKTFKTFTTILACLLVGSVAALAQSNAEMASVNAKAKLASSSAEHTDVANLYGQRADDMIKKAIRHEEMAKSMQAIQPPINHKWPSMAQKPWEKELRLALQARRAAEESRALAAKHIELAEKASVRADVD